MLNNQLEAVKKTHSYKQTWIIPTNTWSFEAREYSSL